MSDFTEYYKKAWELGLIKHTEEIREAEARGMLVGFELACSALIKHAKNGDGFHKSFEFLSNNQESILKPNKK